ncbi:MAG: ABC transporter ATP-binding protein [Armatimonadota bacterium]|nr:ABC transporter ATP-binding protein [Armatimonadota bacterium]
MSEHSVTRGHGADVEVRAVTKRFGPVAAVDDVSLTVRGGEFFSLLGPSGCGKTTTLRVIGGFERTDAGEVFIDGRPMGQTPPNRRPTNIVFQRLALFPHYTVYDNVAFGLRMQRLPDAEVRRRTRDALDLVQLPGLENRRISQLSGGQQQRVALARALVNEPRVLLLDEPLSALDLKLRLQMQEELKRLQHRLGTTFIYVTHDQGEALAMSDRVGVMNAGRLLQVGAPMEIYERPTNRFVANFIGDANLIDGIAGGVERGRVTVRVGGGVVGARARGDEHAGAPVTVCVRPERLRLHASGGPPGALRARIEDRAFSGYVIKYRLAGDGLRLHAAVPYVGGAPLFEVGNEVTVAWDPDQAVSVGRE